MREIPLSQGKVALVDDADYAYLMQWKWYAWWNRCTRSFYAVRNDRTTGKHLTVRMHRVILGLGLGDKRQGDHKNHDTLDNRKSVNLRISTPSQNCCNQGKRRTNSSGFKGTYWHKKMQRWTASISLESGLKYLGDFDSRDLARAAYVKAANAHHGEFANVGD